MTFNKTIRTLIPPIIGYLTYRFFNSQFERYFPSGQESLCAPASFILFELIALVIWTVAVFIFQYKIIVPKTTTSAKRAIKLTLLIGAGISLFLVILITLFRDLTVKEIAISFTRMFMNIESFVLGNLLFISILNMLTAKTSIDRNADN